MKVHTHITIETFKVLYWYDPHIRSWTACVTDLGGFQIGNSVSWHTKGEILEVCEDFAKELPKSFAAE